MGKSQKNDKVGDDVTPPIRQSEHALRVGADQGMRMPVCHEYILKFFKSENSNGVEFVQVEDY